uniref:FG-GAP repeat protein n=1 Tax=uncultured Idiomarina sp. TaxID=352961 RepID=UPI0032B1871E
VVLRDYSVDNNNTEPDLANFTGAGMSTSRNVNLADYNTELVNQTLATEAQFQALVDAINALDDYADGTTNQAPTLLTYQTAGFSTLNPLNVNVMNTDVSSNQLMTLADIQVLVDALDTLASFALDDSNTSPSVTDYANAGLTSVGDNIRSYLNSHLGKEKREGLTHYLKASNATGSDGFGFATAIADDGMTLAVLAYRAPSTSSATEDAGAVYMYRRNGDTWTEVAVLRSEQTSNHAFDMAMTPDGQRVVMLASNVAYIFDVPLVDEQPDWDGTWMRTNYSHGETDTSLYIALSVDGKTMVTGDGNYSSQSGRIRIHQEVDGTWTYRQQHSGSNGTYFAERAVSMNADGSVIAVGAYYENNSRGYVDIFRQETETTWTRTRNNLAPSNADNIDYFGWSVSLNREGDRLAVGARYEDGASNNISDQGAVYIFDYDGSAWNETQILRASDATTGEDFGEWVKLADDGKKLAVSTNDAEAVYTYDLSNADSSTWPSTENIFASPSTRTDGFSARGLAFNGHELVVGAFYDDSDYQGVLTNSDANGTFDENDVSSTGVAFDNTDTSASDSGAAYVIAYEPYALANLEALQARVDGANAILAWAAGGSTSPTSAQYAESEIINVSANNRADVNGQLQGLAHSDMADIQPMVDAINKILAYTTDGTNGAPDVSDYQTAGILDTSASNLTLLNTDVAGNALSMAQIDSVATQSNNLLVLRDYSADNNNATPNIDHFTNAGLSAALAVNLADYNRELDSQILATRAEFEALVSAINALDVYATGQTNPAPTYDTYVTAGFANANATQIDSLNQALAANTLLTLAEIDVVVEGLATLTEYALDDMSTPPLVQDYLDAGLTDVSASILSHLNQTLDREQQTETAFSEYFKSSTPHASDQYGWETALSDDGQLLAVFAYRAPGVENNATDDSGAVYVYRRAGSAWTEVVILRSNQTSNHAHGMAMSADGTRIIMVAPNYAYIFDVPMVESAPDWDGAWTMTTYNHGVSDSTNHLALSADGNTFVVGGDSYNSNQGRIRIHQLVDGNWSFQQQIIGSSNNSYFSNALDISENGEVIAVGAHNQSDTGFVYVYRHNGSTWASDQTFRNSNYATDDAYGWSVSLNRAGTRLAVGAVKEDGESNNRPEQGAVFIHDYDGEDWSQTQVLRGSDADSSDYFSRKVALKPDGSELVVTGANTEAVYHYDLSAQDSSEWQASEQIFASPASDVDEFGTYGLAFNGNAIAVGAYLDDNAFAGFVSNTEIDNDFNENDTASVGSFDKEDDTISDSGAAYLIRVDAYALSNFTTLQARIDESNAILAWAAGGASAPDETNYANASIDSVTADNVSDVNAQLQTLAHTDMADVQPMVNAINKILAYTMDASNPTPTNSDYTLAGIEGVNADNADTLNGYVGGENMAVADIQALVTQVDHLLVLRAYSADEINTEPILDNFTGAGISTSRAINLADYNSELVNQTLTTEAQFQALVDAINALDDYADGTTTTAPSITAYHTAGFDELNAVNLEVINTALTANSLSTLADIQVSVSAIDGLVNYSLGDSTSTPSVDDYTNVGVNDVSNNILDYLNSHLDREKREGFTHYLKASNAHASDGFGFATAISDDGMTLAVLAFRAPSTSSATEDAGAVYMY